ncbi:MAG: hypothetical protein AAB929_06265 [Patescibacteria group bacterium]
MITIQPFSKHITQKAIKYGVEKKFLKQCTYFGQNLQHPSLHTELLEPKKHGIYSFRIDQKYRALFFFRKDMSVIEILSITVHYK